MNETCYIPDPPRGLAYLRNVTTGYKMLLQFATAGVWIAAYDAYGYFHAGSSLFDQPALCKN